MKKGLLALCFVLVGCGSDSSPNSKGNPTPPFPKPMPEECNDKDILEINFKWNFNNQAYIYNYELGFVGSAPFVEETAGTDSVGYTYIEGKRGRKYYFSVNMQDKSGYTHYGYATVEIPKCADRDKFSDDNKDYSEPLNIKISIN